MQYLPELLGSSKSLTLGNGERLAMSEGSFKLLFETGDLEQASPAALLNMVSSTKYRLHTTAKYCGPVEAALG